MTGQPYDLRVTLHLVDSVDFLTYLVQLLTVILYTFSSTVAFPVWRQPVLNQIEIQVLARNITCGDIQKGLLKSTTLPHTFPPTLATFSSGSKARGCLNMKTVADYPEAVL